MISKILTLKNVGPLRDAVGKNGQRLTKFTAFYAENGRGKTTLATVLRSCGLRDASLMHVRESFGSAGDQCVRLLLSDNGMAELRDGKWVGKALDVVVFDSHFVEQNVYSGCEVGAEQKRGLLDFALGNDSVKLKHEVEDITESIKSLTRQRSSAEKAITSHAGELSVAEFVQLSNVEDVEQRIAAEQERLVAARRVKALLDRKDPTPLALLDFDLGATFAVLGKCLENMEKEAETLVKEHFAAHSSESHRQWVEQGQSYLGAGVCPFCGRSLGKVALIEAYRVYFNQAYRNLHSLVVREIGTVDAGLGTEWLLSLERTVGANQDRVGVWADQMRIEAPSFDGGGLARSVTALHDMLLRLLRAKRSALLLPSGSDDDRRAAVEALKDIREAINAYNRELKTTAAAISQRKESIAGDDPLEVEQIIAMLRVTRSRWDPSVVEIVNEYLELGSRVKTLQDRKAKAREELDSSMEVTLCCYQDAINQLLAELGAAFRVVQTESSYKGSGEPRLEYQLEVRETMVPLRSKKALLKELGFGNVLSEGDKRTLALAFFLARLNMDPALGSRVVVLDDPMSSLDRNRRNATIRQILSLRERSAQLVVLSHDAFFVRDLVNGLRERGVAENEMGTLELRTAEEDYSVVARCDIDALCRSPYIRHYELAEDLVAGSYSGDPLSVAKVPRPLLEGYFHRRFPRQVPAGTQLNTVIKKIGDAPEKTPLAQFKPRISELWELNHYFRQFHHDGDGAGGGGVLNVSELRRMARRVLDFIQLG